MKKEFSIWFYLIILAVLFLLNNILGDRINSKTKAIFNNPGYTTGEIVYYSKFKGAVRSIPAAEPHIRYTYYVNGKEYLGNYSASLLEIPNVGQKSGDIYMVVYLKTDPSRSRMLLSYPVKDSTEFLKFKNKFEAGNKPAYRMVEFDLPAFLTRQIPNP